MTSSNLLPLCFIFPLGIIIIIHILRNLAGNPSDLFVCSYRVCIPQRRATFSAKVTQAAVTRTCWQQILILWNIVWISGNIFYLSLISFGLFPCCFNLYCNRCVVADSHKYIWTSRNSFDAILDYIVNIIPINTNIKGVYKY